MHPVAGLEHFVSTIAYPARGIRDHAVDLEYRRLL